MQQLDEEARQKLTERYQKVYKPFLDHLIQVLTEIETLNDSIALAFVIDCCEGLFKSSVEKVLAQGGEIPQTVRGWPI